MIASPSWLKDEFTKEEIKECLAEIRHPLEIAVYSTCNYFNFGAIVRLSHNFLLRKLYAVDIEGGFYKKAAMGSRKYEDIDRCTLEEFLEKSRDRNVVVFERRPDLKQAKVLPQFVWPENPIMFFGGEKFGVPSEVLERHDSDVVTIPVYGVLNDFNVAIAAGIATYDWITKYEQGNRMK
jgi:tRNA G18 (ribose-2'-O)-methylase SpoU